jgi:crossover junction endodeoxyribonuclease RuvC
MRFIGIDPSTKTGFVVLDEKGEVITSTEITGIGKEDPRRMLTMIHYIMDSVNFHAKEGEILIAIEGFPFTSQQAIQLGGIGWALRMAFYKKGYSYIEVAPNALKAYVGVTGWVGEKGNKQRLKGKDKKLAIKAAMEEKYGMSWNSDNINDAFILAMMAREKHIKERIR